MEIAHLQTVNQLNSLTNKSTERLRICALPHRHFEHTNRHASENRNLKIAYLQTVNQINSSTNESTEKLRN